MTFDLVLVGADTITREYLVNKIGTRVIALLARESARPFYAVCDTTKFINADCWRRPVQDGVSVLFEPTPLAHFTGIITEDGVFLPEEASRRAERALIDQRLSGAIEELSTKIR